MKTRILSGLIMVPLLAVLYFGGYVLMLACFLIGVMAVREFYHGFEAMGVKPCYNAAYAAILGLYAINMFTKDYHWYMVWFFGCVLISLLYLFKIEERKLEDGMATVTGIFYIVFFS
ncbi:phosphatidate cytidylyltransferase, partial [Intestinibacillus massiliensis]|nr:phosphatidate cytidylyltransferase [Intestinibacillus massiliensis]